MHRYSNFRPVVLKIRVVLLLGKLQDKDVWRNTRLDRLWDVGIQSRLKIFVIISNINEIRNKWRKKNSRIINVEFVYFKRTGRDRDREINYYSLLQIILYELQWNTKINIIEAILCASRARTSTTLVMTVGRNWRSPRRWGRRILTVISYIINKRKY